MPESFVLNPALRVPAIDVSVCVFLFIGLNRVVASVAGRLKFAMAAGHHVVSQHPALLIVIVPNARVISNDPRGFSVRLCVFCHTSLDSRLACMSNNNCRFIIIYFRYLAGFGTVLDSCLHVALQRQGRHFWQSQLDVPCSVWQRGPSRL